jgi:tetratricopeptide (TPR) repeat protein
VICSLDFRYSRDALLNACGRLIDKGAVWPYLMRARFYFWNGEHDRAIEDFSAFIHQNPDSDKGFNERGLSYAKKGEYDRAIADYTEAIRLNREPVGPYISRGSAYEKKGELDKALADFREALSHGSTTAPEDIKRIVAIQSLLTQQELSLPRPSLRTAMLLTASIGEWALEAQSNCQIPSKSYSLVIDGDNIVWRNGIGNMDVEAVVASDQDEFRTTTIKSIHTSGHGEPVGTSWTYSKLSGDRLKVKPTGRATFLLARCR